MNTIGLLTIAGAHFRGDRSHAYVFGVRPAHPSQIAEEQFVAINYCTIRYIKADDALRLSPTEAGSAGGSPRLTAVATARTRQ